MSILCGNFTPMSIVLVKLNNNNKLISKIEECLGIFLQGFAVALMWNDVVMS